MAAPHLHPGMPIIVVVITIAAAASNISTTPKHGYLRDSSERNAKKKKELPGVAREERFAMHDSTTSLRFRMFLLGKEARSRAT